MDGWMDGCFGSFVLGVEKMIGENASSVGRCPLRGCEEEDVDVKQAARCRWGWDGELGWD